VGKKRNKCYIIVGESTKMLYGAFTYSAAGKEEAKEYIKNLNAGEGVEIKEK